MEGGAATSVYEQRVKATRAKFIERIDQTLNGILSALAPGQPATGAESQTRKVHRLLHDMAGNAAMLDLLQLDEKLRQGVKIAEVADDENRLISAEESKKIQTVIEEAREIGQGLSERV